MAIHGRTSGRKDIIGRCIKCICCNLTAFPTWLIAHTVRLISLSSTRVARRHSPGSISTSLLRRHFDVLATHTTELTWDKQLMRGGGLRSRALCRERCLESFSASCGAATFTASLGCSCPIGTSSPSIRHLGYILSRICLTIDLNSV